MTNKDDDNKVKGLANVQNTIQSLSDLASSTGYGVIRFLEDFRKSVEPGLVKAMSVTPVIPDVEDYIHSMDGIHLEPNPLIELTQRLVDESVLTNEKISSLNAELTALKQKAVETEAANNRRQWTIAITSALIGALAGAIFTLIASSFLF